MKKSKIFVVNGVPRVNPPTAPAAPLSSLPSMTVGAWGDPHMYISLSAINSKKRTVTKKIATWDDNKQGSSGNNELLLLDLQTTTDTVKVYYTNKAYSNQAKVIDNIRVQLNGVSTTYNKTSKFTAGPINFNILKFGSGSSAFLGFEMHWNNINNIVKLKGALIVILKRVADKNGSIWNGGSGKYWDGFSKAAAPYKLSRSDFETGIGIQGVVDDLELLDNEAAFLSAIGENFAQNADIFTDLNDQGADGEGDGAPVNIWDDTTSAVMQVLSDTGGLAAAVDSALAAEVSSVIPCSECPNNCTITLAFRPYYDDNYNGIVTSANTAWPKSFKLTVTGNQTPILNQEVIFTSANYSPGYWGAGVWTKTLSPTLTVTVSRSMGNTYYSSYYPRSNQYYNIYTSSGGVASWDVSIYEYGENSNSGPWWWGPTTISSFEGSIPVLVSKQVAETIIPGVGSYTLELSPTQIQKAFFTSPYSYATLDGSIASNYPQGDTGDWGYPFKPFYYNMKEYTTTKEYFDQGTIPSGLCVSVNTGQRSGYYYSPLITSTNDVTSGQRSIIIEALC